MSALRDELVGQKREVTEQVIDELRRMERMIDTMLASLALEAGALRLRRRPTDLGQSDSHHLFSHGLHGAHPPHRGPPNRGCGGQRHGSGHGSAGDGKPAEQRRQTLFRRVRDRRCTEAVTADTAEIAVRDHGPGVPEKERAVIFERFRQGGHGKSGTGVGLFVVRTVVEAHGGEVGVRLAP